MADLVEQFNRHTSELASEARARPKRRKDRLDDLNSGWEIGVGSTEKYRAGWDFIFGGKGRDNIPAKGKEHAE